MEKGNSVEIVLPKIFQKFWKMFGLTFIDYPTISFYVWLRLGEIYYHRIVFELSFAFLSPLPSFIKMQLGAILTATLQLHIHALCFFLSMPVFCLTHYSLILHFCTFGNVRKPKVSRRFEWVQKWNIGLKWFNPFRANTPFGLPLKTLESQGFLGIFSGIKGKHCEEVGLYLRLRRCTILHLSQRLGECSALSFSPNPSPNQKNSSVIGILSVTNEPHLSCTLNQLGENYSVYFAFLD